MHVISVRNVAQALPAGLNYLLNEGRWEATRNGRALVAPGPVTTVYECPRERVLFSAVRDANPFFHIAESIWMLAGRRDAAFLDRFVGDFGARFAEPDGTVHGAYGYRWRHHFPRQLSAGGFWHGDQLQNCVSVLAADTGSRQAVISMWDPPADLGAVVKDKPCNTHVYLRIRQEDSQPFRDGKVSIPVTEPVLDITVCCRSNDVVLGAYGANAVHFSVLQEYLAARLDVGVGYYYQVSNNYHAYEEQIDKLDERDEGRTLCEDDRYSQALGLVPQPLVHDAESFDEEVVRLLALYEGLDARGSLDTQRGDANVHDEIAEFKNHWLSNTAWPALMAHRHRRNGTWWRRWVERITSPDWREACAEWLSRRERARERKAEVA